MFEADPSVGHRLLAPRIAYVIGTIADGEPDLAPISNLTSVSRTPQVVVVAVYKQWQTYANLLRSEGFTVSVPHSGQNDAVWRLGEKYSHFTPTPGHTKLEECGNPIVDQFSTGPVLADAIGWIECKIIGTADNIESDHGIFFGGVARAFFNERFLTDEGQYIKNSRPVMQLVGNVFATTGDTWTNDYF